MITPTENPSILDHVTNGPFLRIKFAFSANQQELDDRERYATVGVCPSSCLHFSFSKIRSQPYTEQYEGSKCVTTENAITI